MRAKMTAKLCVASVIAGGVMIPPLVRATKRQAAKAARRGAHGYLKARDRVRKAAEATGRPGQMAAIGAALTVKAAHDIADKWWKLVAEVEREEKQETAPDTEPVTTIADYIGTPTPTPPGVR